MQKHVGVKTIMEEIKSKKRNHILILINKNLRKIKKIVKKVEIVIRNVKMNVKRVTKI